MQINWRSIFTIVGGVLLGLSCLMLLLIAMEFLNNSKSLLNVMIPTIITSSVGFLFILINRTKESIALELKEIFIVTFLSWASFSFFASLIIYYERPDLGLLNSLFETVSSVTTTGMSILSNNYSVNSSILLWRAILQWIGGIGIIVMAITIFPVLKIGGMQLFRNEFSDRSEKILPKVSQIAGYIVGIYGFFTILGIFFLNFFNMNILDAFCHCCAAISTGGLVRTSTIVSNDTFILQFILMVLMFIGGSSLILYVTLVNTKKFNIFFENTQFRFYAIYNLSAFLVLSYIFLNDNFNFLDSIKNASFLAVSFITSSGFDYGYHSSIGSEFLSLLFFISIVGGCTGSTAGGIKIFRLEIFLIFLKNYLSKLFKPNEVHASYYQGKKISEQNFINVLGFICLYFLLIAIFSILLSFSGLSFETSISGAVSCMGNTGICIDKIIGSGFELQKLSAYQKIIMMLAMIIGRLEIFSVIILFSPSFWKK